MNVLIQNGKHSIISQFQIEKKLNNDFYRLDWDKFGNLFLIKIETPILPNNYMDIRKNNRDIILSVFKHSKGNLGVAFKGVKGTGKTVDAKKLSIETKLPVIIIDKPILKQIDLSSFLLSIEQDIVIFIDEFGKNFKNYDDDEGEYQKQENLLSILDGINSSYKRLFIFTTNEELNEFMVNRPSRIKFLIEYNYLKIEEVQLLLKEVSIKKEYLKDLLKNLDSSNLTIDILFSIIDLINTIDKPYSEFKSIFNYIVSDSYYFISETNQNNNFITNLKGKLRVGNSIYLDNFDKYGQILQGNKVKIDDEVFTFKKTFMNLNLNISE